MGDEIPRKFERLCPECKDVLHAKAVACACGWRQNRNKPQSRSPEYGSTCEWNDHGHTCGGPGVISSSTGGGNWYCRQHWAKLMGWNWPPSDAPVKSYRERWFETNEQPYVAPGVGDYAPFRCVGRDLEKMAAPKRKALPVREPGEDTQEEVYGETA